MWEILLYQITSVNQLMYAETTREGEEVLNLDKKFRLNIKLDSKTNSTEIEKGLVRLR